MSGSRLLPPLLQNDPAELWLQEEPPKDREAPKQLDRIAEIRGHRVCLTLVSASAGGRWLNTEVGQSPGKCVPNHAIRRRHRKLQKAATTNEIALQPYISEREPPPNTTRRNVKPTTAVAPAVPVKKMTSLSAPRELKSSRLRLRR